LLENLGKYTPSNPIDPEQKSAVEEGCYHLKEWALGLGRERSSDPSTLRAFRKAFEQAFRKACLEFSRV
jgi:hypothetical protein